HLSALVQVTITGQSAKLLRANMLVRFVSIKANNKPGEISLETAIDTEKQRIDPSSGEQCHISYQLFVPAGLKLSVTNRFGNVHIKNFDGDLSLDEKFGDLKVEHTTGPIKLDVEQGNADIDRLRGGSLKFKGFTRVRIGKLSGAVDAKFWSGGRVDLGLTGDLQKLSINAANVNPLNITNLKPANADLKIHSMVSKIIYNGHIMFVLDLDKRKLNLSYEKPPKADTVFITGMGKSDTTQKPRDKPANLDLKKISIVAMKKQDYMLKTGTATTDITIDAAFCVVNVKD
ncbi:MAG TPA: hypothetical protein VHS53_09570, partial [Mucilaginibacter sp.]|nr:hypothetical protein [Mucilaginibacter sp.]